MTHPDSGRGSADFQSPVLSRREGPVLVLTLNRPHRLNAVNTRLYTALVHALSDPGPEVRSVVLTGAGRAFCAGADLKAHAAGSPEGA